MGSSGDISWSVLQVEQQHAEPPHSLQRQRIWRCHPSDILNDIKAYFCKWLGGADTVSLLHVFLPVHASSAWAILLHGHCISWRCAQPPWHGLCHATSLPASCETCEAYVLVQALPLPPPIDLFMSWLGAFLAILLLAGLNSVLEQSELHFQLLVASFGASAVLVFGVPDSKLAQPCNLVGQQVYLAL